ncbi:MAG: YdhR family protein [Dehalococcoidia bacterium]|nr:hypothetical protein [Chloroflexi bacterium CFX7]MCK6565739.1 YdhR family protein [Dehalococcoidia bacterium]NUQ54787.1 YdhR family protein [Dehalococcoidia bacterium]
MRAILVLWNLSSGSNATFEQLRDYLRNESIARFSAMPGLRQKTWISNPETGLWGAMYLFETAEQARELASHISTGRVAQLTGLAPATIEQFDVEAVTEGQHAGADLLTVGLAR